jgi:hypothetical protein
MRKFQHRHKNLMVFPSSSAGREVMVTGEAPWKVKTQKFYKSADFWQNFCIKRQTLQREGNSILHKPWGL